MLTHKKKIFLDPVLLCNDLGTKRDPKNPGAVVKSNGHGSISVKEAVRVAQSNNFMGLVCNSRLLVSFFSLSSSSSSSFYSSLHTHRFLFIYISSHNILIFSRDLTGDMIFFFAWFAKQIESSPCLNRINQSRGTCVGN